VTAARTGPVQPAPTCRQTGSPRGSGACMAARDGSCGYCGLPAPDADARARLDERAQLNEEVYR
jgi:hypothetical protein